MNDPDNKVYSSMMLDKDVLKGMTQGKSWAVMKTDADFMGSKIAGAESINDIVKSMFSGELLKAGFNAKGAALTYSNNWSGILGGDVSAELDLLYGSVNGDVTISASSIDASIKAKVAVLQASGEWKAGQEGDFLSAVVKAEGSLLSAEASANFGASWGKDGVKLDAGFNAMASVASGEVSGTFNFLGLFEVEAAAKGYALGAGIEGSAGFDSKTGEVKASFGASLGLGGGLSFSAKPKGVFADFLGLSGNSDKYSSSASINTDIGRQYSKTSTTTVDVSKTRGGSTKQVDTTIKTATTNSGKKTTTSTSFQGTNNKSTTYTGTGGSISSKDREVTYESKNGTNSYSSTTGGHFQETSWEDDSWETKK